MHHLAALAPDAVLVRQLGLARLLPVARTAGTRPLLHGDFSLNVTNSITAGWAARARPRHAHRRARSRPRSAAGAARARRAAGSLSRSSIHHIPTFHTEHCVYAHLLSTGRDYRTCGRPCERHEVALRDRVGLVRTRSIVDVGCRNTVFNAQAQTAAALVPELVARGVRRFRVELVRETRAETAAVLAAYGDLLAGRDTPAEAVRRAHASAHFGVARAPMAVRAE